MVEARVRMRDQRMFLRFWVVRAGATSASQMLNLVMGWQMYELTNSAWDLGLIGLVQFIPLLLVSLPAGQLADRMHRGQIVALCLAVQGLGAGLLLVASSQDATSRALVLTVAALFGVARGFQMPAQQALVPLLVPPALLSRAMALSASAGQVAIMGGPAIGGVLLLAGAPAAYAGGLFLLALSFGLAALLRYEHIPAARTPINLHSLLAGARFVMERKVLLGAMSLDLFAVLLGGVTALLPMFARDVLQVGPAGLGMLRAAPAVGAVVMAIILARVSLNRRVGVRLMGAVVIYAAAMGVFGLSSVLWLSLCALAVSGAADMVSVVVRHTLVQAETPDEMRGRVGAVNAMFLGASNQLGEFESGATAAVMGPVGSVVFGAVATLCIAAAWLRLFPQLVRRDRFTTEPPPT